MEAITASLIKNQTQEALHPANQFEAFSTLVESGKTVEYVAALFGASPRSVQRRLKLARASPKRRALFPEHRIALEQFLFSIALRPLDSRC